ncbi:hypothetical protein VCUG_01088 [Vavraia culicis subsp. floridensis]|uniref:Uncharacterized protein n=1 Tax=Vavraia culicis (isolate floridensis) TaxID=948595 RepID=L2GVR9_VAVCU|nr:uncharacterized protein VCUG_01088 [Vavraia culicis subsp. floridensis]ELA47437.1 hypothetical protein VCUG_01088 [Vavraia culicis subsp. floridensis]
MDSYCSLVSCVNISDPLQNEPLPKMSIGTNLLCLLESSQYFDFDILPEISAELSLQLIKEGNICTLSSQVFVIDICDEAVTVLFVDEMWNERFAYLKRYFELCLRKRDFLLFFILLRHFLRHEDQDKTYVLDNEHEYIRRVNAIRLYPGRCGRNVLFKHGLFFCECVFHSSTAIKSLEHSLHGNIFVHDEKVEPKNDVFEIKGNSFFFKGQRDKKMSFLLKKGFTAEEIFNFFGVGR